MIKKIGRLGAKLLIAFAQRCDNSFNRFFTELLRASPGALFQKRLGVGAGCGGGTARGYGRSQPCQSVTHAKAPRATVTCGSISMTGGFGSRRICVTKPENEVIARSRRGLWLLSICWVERFETQKARNA